MVDVVVDTSVFLDNLTVVRNTLNDENVSNVILLSIVLDEINKIKDMGHFDQSRKAQDAVKMIAKEFDKDETKLVYVESDYQAYNETIANDTCILRECEMEVAHILTNDIHMRLKATLADIPVYLGSKSKEIELKGFHEICLSHDELAEFYIYKENKWDVAANEYLVLIDEDDKWIDSYCWTGREFRKVRFKSFDSGVIGKVNPINNEQRLLFDMLQNTNASIKMVTGGFGTGKDFILLSDAFERLNKGEFEKIVYVRNNVPVADTNDIGFLPGTLEEKMLPYMQPLLDHIGGQDGLMMLGNKIEFQHLGFIRGRDIQNSIIYVTEAENMTREQMQLVMGRVGKGSQLYINGDNKQVDDNIFRRNNGILAMLEGLRGHRSFSHINLRYSERSEVARMSELL